MIQNERQNNIAYMLYKHNKVYVRQLSKYFSVSEPTIRSDLIQLESEGIVCRFHGGAILKDNTKQKASLFLNEICDSIDEKNTLRKLHANLSKMEM